MPYGSAQSPTTVRGASLAPMLRVRGLHLALDPNGDPSGGGGGTAAPDRERVADVVRQYDRNPHRVAKQLLARIAELEKKLETAGAPQGGRVLTAEEAKEYEARVGLGKLEEVQAALAERDTLKQALAERTALDARTEFFEKAADVYGWDKAAARKVAARVPITGTYEFREVEVDDGKGGKTKKPIPHVVTGEGAASKAEPLDAVMQRDHDLLMPALVAKSDAAPPARRDAAPLPPAPRTTGTADGAVPAVAQSVARRVAGAF